MKPLLKPVGGAFFGLLILYGIARGSLAEYTPVSPAATQEGASSRQDDDATMSALLRLSWRTRGEPVHACRQLSPEELEALPTHMRRDEVCETRILPWHLHLVVDGRTLVNDTIMPAGARQDRPLYVFRDFPLRPGHYDFEVRFEQLRADQPDDPGGETQRAGAGTPQTLARSGTLEVTSGEIALITYDPDSRSLVVRQPIPRDSPEPLQTEITR